MGWIKKHRNCSGILSPIIKEKRHIYSIQSNESRCLEINNKQSANVEHVTIGKYIFSNEIFDWARKQILFAAYEEKQWLVIDEIGPLELSGAGLEPAITEIFQNYNLIRNRRLLLVVRENLVEQVIKHYQIQNITGIHKNLPETR
jgi:nucleoside-triphosphatase THEP1